jgi:hypothetical protein
MPSLALLALRERDVVADESGCSCDEVVGDRIDGSEQVIDDDTSDGDMLGRASRGADS